MPTGPSVPKIQPTKTKPPPTPRSVRLETEKEAIRRSAQKRKGYASTVMTRGVTLGEPLTERKKAERLGVTGV